MTRLPRIDERTAARILATYLTATGYLGLAVVAVATVAVLLGWVPGY